MIDLTPDEVMEEMLKRTGRRYTIAVCHRVVCHPRNARAIDYKPRAARTVMIMGKAMEMILGGDTFRQIIEEYDMKKQYATTQAARKRLRAL